MDRTPLLCTEECGVVPITPKSLTGLIARLTKRGHFQLWTGDQPAGRARKTGRRAFHPAARAEIRRSVDGAGMAPLAARVGMTTRDKPPPFLTASLEPRYG